MPIPPLGFVLLHMESQKGSPLTEREVIAARENAGCIMMPLSDKEIEGVVEYIKSLK